ncbi:MAG TPA: hypothetical protein VH062_02080 [Polyangiaceae bacterium]|jgi:hypothetical protein|nr:hypothetical protein [Polyangiaceae bacterium]
MSERDDASAPEQFPLQADPNPPADPLPELSQLDRIEAMLTRAHDRFDEIDLWRKEVDEWRQKNDQRLGDGNTRFGFNEANITISINTLIDLLVRMELPGEADRLRAVVAKNTAPPLGHLDGE